MYKKSIELTNQLLTKLNDIKLNKPAALFGNSPDQSVLNDLKKKIIELEQALKKQVEYDEVINLYEVAVASLDTAGITGLISEAEIPEFYKITDDIWVSIEKEK